MLFVESYYMFSQISPKLSWDIHYFTGRSTTNHPGNIRFRELIDAKQHAYDAIDCQLWKTPALSAILSEILESGGRFLEQVEIDGTLIWLEVSDERARVKVSLRFRSKRRKLKIDKQKQHSIE